MHIQNLFLQQFRSHQSLTLDLTDKPIVLHGVNGAGKTNILEAVSFFAPGRGLRSVVLSQIRPLIVTPHPTIVGLVLRDASSLSDIRLVYHYDGEKRLNKIQGERISSVMAFAEWVSVFWLTPEHDSLLSDNARARRRFFDRMIFTFDTAHGQHLQTFEALAKERLTVLATAYDAAWLSIIEGKMATHAVAIIRARQRFMALLNEQRHFLQPFTCHYVGDNHDECLNDDDLHLFYQTQWAQLRGHDGKVHQTTLGPHKGDFNVSHTLKGEGKYCSTGEQKLLVMSIFFSYLYAKRQHDRKLNIILLDECLSHFDFAHRRLLLDQICDLQADKTQMGSFHFLLSGTDDAFFDSIKSRAAFYAI